MACYECKYNVKRIWKYGESISEEEIAVNVQLLALYFGNSAILSQNIRVPFSLLDTVQDVVATFCRSF